MLTRRGGLEPGRGGLWRVIEGWGMMDKWNVYNLEYVHSSVSARVTRHIDCVVCVYMCVSCECPSRPGWLNTILLRGSLVSGQHDVQC